MEPNRNAVISVFSSRVIPNSNESARVFPLDVIDRGTVNIHLTVVPSRSASEQCACSCVDVKVIDPNRVTYFRVTVDIERSDIHIPRLTADQIVSGWTALTWFGNFPVTDISIFPLFLVLARHLFYVLAKHAIPSCGSLM